MSEPDEVPSSPAEDAAALDKPVSWRLRQWAVLCALDVIRVDPKVGPLVALAAQIVSFVTNGEDAAGNA